MSDTRNASVRRTTSRTLRRRLGDPNSGPNGGRKRRPLLLMRFGPGHPHHMLAHSSGSLTTDSGAV